MALYTSFPLVLIFSFIFSTISAQTDQLEGSWICEDECLLLGDYRAKAFTISSESQEFIAAAIYEEGGVMNLVADFELKASAKTLNLKLIFSAIENTPPKGSKYSIKWALDGESLVLNCKGKKSVYTRLIQE